MRVIAPAVRRRHLCINHIKLNMVNTALGGQFNLHMQVSMVTGVVLAVPYLLWEIWRFVAPALTSYERYKAGCSCSTFRCASFADCCSAIF